MYTLRKQMKSEKTADGQSTQRVVLRPIWIDVSVIGINHYAI